MRALRAARVAWIAVVGVATVLGGAGFVAALGGSERIGPRVVEVALDRLGIPDPVAIVALLVVPATSCLVAAVLIFAKRSSEPVALVTSLALATLGLGFTRATYFLALQVPATAWLASVVWWTALLSFAAALCVFPDGRLVPRWAAAGPFGMVVASVVMPRLPWTILELPEPPRDGARFFVATAFAVAAYVVGFAAQIHRYRRVSGRLERQQAKWVVGPAATLGATLVAAFVLAGTLPNGWEVAPGLAILAVAVPFTLLPAGVATAILRHRLWDIDLVVSRGVVHVGLLAFTAAAYLAVVGMLGALTDTGTRWPALVATAVVALSFDPVRTQLTRAVNRVVYGGRTSPEDVLTAFPEQVSGSYDPAVLLPTIARAVGEATGAAQAAVWLRVGDSLERRASWPYTGLPPASLRLVETDSKGTAPALPAADRAVDVRHAGELLAVLTIASLPGAAVSATEERLLADLAGQAGLVLRNVRLTAELAAGVEVAAAQARELADRRRRIVEAHDIERRGLERDIHDGAQQHLVALAVKIGLARTVARDDPGRLPGALAELRESTRLAIHTLAELAGGLAPAALRTGGLEQALHAHAVSASLDLRLEADSSARYAPALEEAAYFCCTEAMQNVAKHARGSQVHVVLSLRPDVLGFSVSDDGPGFDVSAPPAGTGLTNMRDRLAAVGGFVAIESGAGRGTTVTGRIPAPPEGRATQDAPGA